MSEIKTFTHWVCNWMKIYMNIYACNTCKIKIKELNAMHSML